MKYYPLLLDLKDKRCVVVGAGEVARRKAGSLLRAGACVKVISPTLNKALRLLKRKKRLLHIKSAYQKKYLENTFLVIAATSNSKVNSRVAKDAQVLGILTNVVDSAAQSNFIVPAVIHRGDLIISVSTSGKAPCLSKKIKKDLNRLIVPQYAKFLDLLEEIRQDLKQRCQKPKLRKAVLSYLANSKKM